MSEQTETPDTAVEYVVRFESDPPTRRNPNPEQPPARLVGPFDTREAAFEWAETVPHDPSVVASWGVEAVHAPWSDERAGYGQSRGDAE